MQALLDVKDLTTSFFTERGELRVVDRVSFSIAPGRLMGLVGESGSGKTVTALSIMRLLPERAQIVGGQIMFDGRNLCELSEEGMRAIRGAKIAMIFQEPMTSLNPVFTIGSQIMEAIRLHQKTSRAEARNRAIEMLRDGENRRPAAAYRRLSPSAIGRDAPAGDDRDGAVVPAANC